MLSCDEISKAYLELNFEGKVSVEEVGNDMNKNVNRDWAIEAIEIIENKKRLKQITTREKKTQARVALRVHIKENK